MPPTTVVSGPNGCDASVRQKCRPARPPLPMSEFFPEWSFKSHNPRYLSVSQNSRLSEVTKVTFADSCPKPQLLPPREVYGSENNHQAGFAGGNILCHHRPALLVIK